MSEPQAKVGAGETAAGTNESPKGNRFGRKFIFLAALLTITGFWFLCSFGSEELVHRIGLYCFGRPSALRAPPVHFKNMLAYQQRMDASIPEGAVIFLGDSITQSLAVAAVAPISINLGIGQQSTRLMLEALPSYRSLYRAGIIVVTIGVNDLLHGQSEGLSDRLRQINRALPRNKAVIWNAIMPIRTIDQSKEVRDAILSANNLIETLCAGRERCVFVDTWKLFSIRQEAIYDQYFLDDGIHLSDAGYRKWILELRNAIKKFETAAYVG